CSQYDSFADRRTLVLFAPATSSGAADAAEQGPDFHGLCTAPVTIVAGVAYTLGFGYDAAGNRTLMSSAAAVTVKTYYAGRRPSQLTLGPGSSQPHVRDVTWYPFGPRTQAKFADEAVIV